jgi:DNA-binding MarR family transcriptional regulator
MAAPITTYEPIATAGMLSQRQRDVLLALYQYTGQTVYDLASEGNAAVSTIRGCLATLRRLGCVTSDTRLWEVTAHGTAVAEKIHNMPPVRPKETVPKSEREFICDQLRTIERELEESRNLSAHLALNRIQRSTLPGLRSLIQIVAG